MNGNDSVLFQQQTTNIVHPFSPLIDTNYNPLVMDYKAIAKSKKIYDELRITMKNNIGVKFYSYDTYIRKVNVAKVLILRFTKMCLKNKLVVGLPREVFEFVRNKLPVLVKMLEGKSKLFLSNKIKVVDAITLSNFRSQEGKTTKNLAHKLKSKWKARKTKLKKRFHFHKGMTHPNHKKANNNMSSQKTVIEKPNLGGLIWWLHQQ